MGVWSISLQTHFILFRSFNALHRHIAIEILIDRLHPFFGHGIVVLQRMAGMFKHEELVINVIVLKRLF